MKFLIKPVLLILLITGTATAQTTISISSGATYSEAKYDKSSERILKQTPGYSWGANASLNIPLSKKLILQTAIELINKKFTVNAPLSSFAGLKRTERCAYLGIKPSLHYLILSRHHFKLSAGTGFFINAAVGGKYNETDQFGVPAPAPYAVNADLKIGNTIGNSYKRADAGCSFQVIGHYKRFMLPIIADFSFSNNIPTKRNYDSYGMPVASSGTRKWQSIYAGIGYLFLLTKIK